MGIFLWLLLGEFELKQTGNNKIIVSLFTDECVVWWSVCQASVFISMSCIYTGV